MHIGEYDVVKQISEGTFGRTFLGVHELLREKVCLKQEKTGDPVYMDLFRKEAKLLWNISHVSLPTSKAYYEFSDFGQVFVMSFIEGEDLSTVAEKRGFVDDEHLCWIMQRLLDALSYLHFHRVIHCDIKPQNILLDIPNHNATLVDFGLYVADPTHASKAKGGTPFFMPCEFAQGLPPIPASDLYSLGMTMVFLSGGNIGNGALPTNMHADLKEFINAMIRRDPLARPQSARSLNQELSSLRRRIFGRTETKEMFKVRASLV